MARKKRQLTKEQKKQEEARKRQHKLNSIKNEFESGKIISFEQIFAVMAETRFNKELKMGYSTFRHKWTVPGDFTLNELLKFADLLDVDINIILKFIFSLIKTKHKSLKSDGVLKEVVRVS